MRKNKSIYYICLVSIFSAMAIVLEKFVTIRIGTSIKITLYALPLLVMGINHGKYLGMITGVVTGLVLQLTSPYGIGVTSFFWGLAPVAWGFFSGLLFELLEKLNTKKNGKIIRYILTIFIASLCATILNTLAMVLDTLLIKDTTYTFAKILTDLPIRLLTMVIALIPYVFITYIVCDRLNNYK